MHVYCAVRVEYRNLIQGNLGIAQHAPGNPATGQVVQDYQHAPGNPATGKVVQDFSCFSLVLEQMHIWCPNFTYVTLHTSRAGLPNLF